jgi:hypothetical protein
VETLDLFFFFEGNIGLEIWKDPAKPLDLETKGNHELVLVLIEFVHTARHCARQLSYLLKFQVLLLRVAAWKRHRWLATSPSISPFPTYLLLASSRDLASFSLSHHPGANQEETSVARQTQPGRPNGVSTAEGRVIWLRGSHGICLRVLQPSRKRLWPLPVGLLATRHPEEKVCKLTLPSCCSFILVPPCCLLYFKRLILPR